MPAGRSRWIGGAVLVGVLVLVALAAAARLRPDAGAMATEPARVRIVAPPAEPGDDPDVRDEDGPRVAFDVLSRLPDELRRELVAAEPAATPRPFRFHVAVPPEEVCEAMDASGLANAGWTERGNEWQCESDLVPLPRDGVGAGGGVPSTLYFAARGPTAGRLAVVRFKLNADDPATESEGLDRLYAALDRLSGPLAWSLPEAARRAIRGYRRYSTHERGVTVEIHPETGEVRRINVVLILQQPSAQLSTERFQPVAGD